MPQPLNKTEVSAKLAETLGIDPANIPSAQYFLELSDRGILMADGFKEIMGFIADKKMRDASNFDLTAKQNLLQNMADTIRLKKCKTVDRRTFSKELKDELLLLERDTYLDLADMDNYRNTQKDRFKISTLRKYGPTKDPYVNPLRNNFKKLFEERKYIECKELVLRINFRRASNILKITKELLHGLEDRFSFCAKAHDLHLNELSEHFAKEYKNISFKGPSEDSLREKQVVNSMRIAKKNAPK